MVPLGIHNEFFAIEDLMTKVEREEARTETAEDEDGDVRLCEGLRCLLGGGNKYVNSESSPVPCS